MKTQIEKIAGLNDRYPLPEGWDWMIVTDDREPCNGQYVAREHVRKVDKSWPYVGVTRHGNLMIRDHGSPCGNPSGKWLSAPIEVIQAVLRRFHDDTNGTIAYLKYFGDPCKS